MADKKISELTSASVVNSTDAFVIVQAGETRKISPEVLFKNVPVSVVSKEVPEVIENGAISIVIATTVIDSSAFNDVELTLAAGSNGIEKTIVCLNLIPSYKATVSVTNGRNVNSIQFNDPGDSVHLKYILGYWYVVGSKGVIIG